MILNYNIYNVIFFKMIQLKTRLVVLPGIANFTDSESAIFPRDFIK
jgi:hypothetical protein